MSLKDQLEKDFIEAYKARDISLSSILRLVKSSIKNAEIANKKELDDNEVISILKKEIKQRSESEAEYRKAGRNDLAEKELFEAEAISKYLPVQLNEEAISRAVDKAILELNAENMSDMGKVMAQLMKTHGPSLDGALASKIVKEKLSQKQNA